MEPYLGINHHDNVTKNSYKLMNTLQEKHRAKIANESGDADFDDMISFFAPFNTGWTAGYTKWKSAGDTSQGKTEEMKTFIATLTHTNIPKWEVAIYSKYPEGSPKAIALLPNKRTPYITGSQFDRITALETLATNIGSDADLATIKSEIIAFHTDILACYEEHQGMMKNITESSKDLEPLRIAIAQAMFANEGALMKKFYLTPKKVDLFFDISSMRKSHMQPSDEGGMVIPLLPGEIKLLDVLYKGTEIWEVTDDGEHDAAIFFSDKDDLTEIPATNKYIVTTGESKQIDLSTLPATYRFAYVANLSAEDEGQVTITEI